jgi:hypothetical protein
MSVTVYQSTRSHIPAVCVSDNSRTAVAAIGGVADSTEVRKWKCLFVNDSECNRLINAATECFSPCQNVTNASLCLGIVLKSDGVSVGQ